MLFGPEHAWIRSRKISQSSRAWPGARTARLRRCKRPSPLIIDPRFSAKARDGSTTVACSVAAFERISITMKAESFCELFGRNSQSHRVFAQRDQCLYMSGFHGVRDGGQFCAGLRSYSKQSRAVGVRISIFAQKNIVAGTCARYNIDQLNTERSGELQCHPKFFVGHPARSDDCNFQAGQLL